MPVATHQDSRMIVVLCNFALATSSEDFKGILKDLDSDGDGKLSSRELEERLNALALATIAKNATAPPGTLRGAFIDRADRVRRNVNTCR